ncbi:hypothetical protein ABEF95_003545 [Exophiala dermatitidis]
MDLSPSTWRALGLFVSASYIGLGTFSISCPALAAKCFGIYPDDNDNDNSTGTSVSSKPTGETDTSGHIPLATAREKHVAAVSTSMLLLGSRDLSIGIALAWLGLDSQHNPRAMGAVILSGFVLSVVDVYEIWRLRGSRWAALFAAGAGVWMGVGSGLIQ